MHLKKKGTTFFTWNKKKVKKHLLKRYKTKLMAFMIVGLDGNKNYDSACWLEIYSLMGY